MPLQMHNAIAGLISMALSSKQAQDLLVERIEDLQEPIRTLPGGILLQRVLESLPLPGDEKALRDFAENLPPEQALALRSVPLENYPEDRLDEHVNFACARAVGFALRERIDTLRGRIRELSDDPEKLSAALKELQQLQLLLSTTDSPES